MSEETAKAEAQERGTVPRDPPPYAGRAPTPQERQAAAFEAAGDGWFDVDLAAGTCVFGGRADGLVGLPTFGKPVPLSHWNGRVHPEDRAAAEAAWLACLQGGEACYDARFRLPAGGGCGWRWVRARGRVIERAADGRARRVAGVLRDVDEVHQRLYRESEVLERRHRQALAEARLQGFEARSNEIELLLHPDGTVVDANDRALASYGWTREELRRRSIRDLRDPATVSAMPAQLSQAQLDGGVRFETRHRRRDGSTFPVEVSSRGFLVGGERYLHSLVRDLTEREAADADRRTMAGLLRTMSDAVLLTDLRFNVTQVAGATTALLGWSEPDLLGRNLLLDFGVEFPDGDEAAHHARLESGLRSRVNVRFPTRAGGQQELDLAVGPLRDGAGRPTGYVLLGRDQGRLHLAERALREAEQRLQLVLRSSLTGYWEWDLEAEKLVHDQRFHTWVEVPASLSGDVEHLCRQLADPEDAPRLAEEVRAVAEGRADGLAVEHRRPRGKGTEAWVRVAGVVLERGSDGRVRRIGGTVTDVTERHELEDRERRAERVASVGTLVRGLAHEVNNPLATVIANLAWLGEVLADLPAPVAGAWAESGVEPLPELAGALRDASDGAARVRGIVADLKAFAADLPRPQAQASLEVALKKALRLAHHALEITAGVAVSCPRLPDLGLPEDELVQALAQVLVNAGQATGAAPNQVRVAADLLDVTRVQVIVADTGVGMDAATRARAFEPFFTTGAVGAGRGLGLSVCRGIVGAAGGSLELQSAPGHGTLVRMVLPVYRPPR